MFGQVSHPLDTYQRAFNLLLYVQNEIDNGVFDAAKYVAGSASEIRKGKKKPQSPRPSITRLFL